MPEIYFLSKEDVEILRRVVDREKRSIKNTTQRPWVSEPQYGSSSVYIALPPSSGIPALTRQTVGTGSVDTPTEYDSPGQALCKIYQIVDTGETATGTGSIPDLVEAFELAQPVYNLSDTEIGYDWIHVHKDAYGSWLAVTGGGCDSQNTIWDITVFGTPTGGTFALTFEVNGVSDTVTITFNDSASTVAGLIAGHSQVGVLDVTGVGGPLPNAMVRIEFTGDLANTLIALPLANFSLLTGGSGRGIIVAMSQRGH